MGDGVFMGLFVFSSVSRFFWMGIVLSLRLSSGLKKNFLKFKMF